MTFRRAVAGLAVAFAASLGFVSAQEKPQMAENVFKNVQVLKGIPVDEFMDTMGMFSSALLSDCTGCHVKEALADLDALAIATPRITRARGMVAMVNIINKQFFGGQPRVSCFTCHRGDDTPRTVPDLQLQYGEPLVDPNSMTIVADPSINADKVFARYLEALGGADRVAARTSFIATGTNIGFNTDEVELPFEIYARAPNLRTEIIKSPLGDHVKTFDGRNGWAAEGWRLVPFMPFTGDNLAGVRFDATVAFPATLRKAYAEWKGTNSDIDGEPVVLLQGSNPGNANELPVNLYFDEDGLLVRTVRWNRTPVGTVPTQTQYSDYKDVGGVKMPFKWVYTWTNGQNTIELDKVQPNAAIPDTRFARPAPFKPKQ
jgi:hypothetical protein